MPGIVTNITKFGPITVVSHLKGGCVVSIKDGRYNIDTDLAKAISI